jgi:hypothetical protein
MSFSAPVSKIQSKEMQAKFNERLRADDISWNEFQDLCYEAYAMGRLVVVPRHLALQEGNYGKA